MEKSQLISLQTLRRQLLGQSPEIMILTNKVVGGYIGFTLSVGVLIHEAGTVIQAPKPVCQFMAEDIPPPVLNQLVIRYLVNLLVRIK